MPYPIVLVPTLRVGTHVWPLRGLEIVWQFAPQSGERGIPTRSVGTRPPTADLRLPATDIRPLAPSEHVASDAAK